MLAESIALCISIDALPTEDGAVGTKMVEQRPLPLPHKTVNVLVGMGRTAPTQATGSVVVDDTYNRRLTW